jgi:hypothetical protein
VFAFWKPDEGSSDRRGPQSCRDNGDEKDQTQNNDDDNEHRSSKQPRRN